MEENGPVVPFGPRHRSNGANGRRPEGMSTRPVRMGPPSDDEGPLDMVAVQADDALISALAGGLTVAAHGRHGTDDHVASVLAAWKADIDAEPIPELVDLDTAVATILEANRPPGRRLRHLAPVAAAAAVAVLALGGVTVGSASAQPDSVFWPVSKVLFSERAASVEAADSAEDHITRAKILLTNGDPRAAAAELAEAQKDLRDVRPQEGKAQLSDVQSFLAAKADETPPKTKVDLSAPLRSNPSRPVPSGTALTQDPDPTVGSHKPRTWYPPTPVQGVPPLPTVAVTTTEKASPSVPPDGSGGTGGGGSGEPTKETTVAPTTTATVEGTPDPPAGTTTTGMGTTTTAGGTSSSSTSTTPT